MGKEGVRVKSLVEARKGKNLILFERLFSRNKKISALTEVKENQYLTASGIKSHNGLLESNSFGNKPQEIIAQYAWLTV